MQLQVLRRFSTNTSIKQHPLRVLVTGGSKGIGLGLTEVFASKSCNVLSVDIDKEANNILLQSSINKNGNIHCLTKDVTESITATECIEYMIDKWNGIDLLINNVGVELANDKKMHELPDEIWHLTMNVNINSFFYFSKAAVIQMLKQIEMENINIKCYANDDIENNNKYFNYNIINIASPCGFVGVPCHSAYCASKGATLSLTKQMAIDYAPNIRVNSITPGATLTPNVKNTLAESGFGEDTYDSFVQKHPMQRWGNAIEYGKLAWYLASDDASFITGSNMVIDGGILTKPSWMYDMFDDGHV
eukprot:40558_1